MTASRKEISMHTRQRTHEDQQQAQAAPAISSELEQLRASADRLLAAGTDAIDRALSSDSRAFLDANRQEGGQ
jgi:hypothetical protein